MNQSQQVTVPHNKTGRPASKMKEKKRRRANWVQREEVTLQQDVQMHKTQVMAIKEADRKQVRLMR